VEATEQKRFAWVLRLGEPARLVDLDAVVVGGAEGGEGGDVAVGAVGVAGPCRERHLHLRPGEDDLLRFDLDAGRQCDVVVVVGCAGADPVDEGLCRGTARLEELAAGVRDGADRLGNEERFLR
jgi:hypothetical protein